MKKLRLLFTVAFFATLLLTSCEREVTAIILDTAGLALEVGDEYTLMATVIPDNATKKMVTWVSGNPAVASVSANGKVTAVSVGSTIITAQIGKIYTVCAVAVIAPIPVVSITLNKTSLNLGVGEEFVLTATVLPATSIKPVTWTSSKPDVATVSSGIVKGISAGTATITAQAGDKKATCTVTVADLSYDAGVTINGKKWATRNVGEPGKFAASPQEPGMFYQWNRKIGWSVTDPMENSNGSSTWNPSNPTGTSWTSTNDPCPAGWRVPTKSELTNLSTGGSWKTTPAKGYSFGSGNNTVFLPAAGARNVSGILGGVGECGAYWSSTQEENDGAWSFYFENGYKEFIDAYRTNGISVRCIQ